MLESVNSVWACEVALLSSWLRSISVSESSLSEELHAAVVSARRASAARLMSGGVYEGQDYVCMSSTSSGEGEFVTFSRVCEIAGSCIVGD